MNKHITSPSDTPVPHPSTLWETDLLDLPGYLERIGYDGTLEPTLDTLRALQAAHLDAIVFEGLDPVLGRPVRTDIESIQDKLVHRRRGGYCHEHNILFATVLDRIGFHVTGRSARMLMGTDPREIGAVGHTILSVVVDGVDWHVDVGIGNVGPRGPVPLVDGAEVDTGPWRYRMERADRGHWLLRLRRPDGWFDIVQFTEERYYRADYADHNFLAAHQPSSPFSHRIIVQYNGAGERWSLTDLTLINFRPEGGKSVREITPDALPETLRSVFGLHLPEEHEKALVDRARTPVTSEWDATALGQ